jgi:hypothetical protein
MAKETRSLYDRADDFQIQLQKCQTELRDL